jgi:hypothetical protein
MLAIIVYVLPLLVIEVACGWIHYRSSLCRRMHLDFVIAYSVLNVTYMLILVHPTQLGVTHDLLTVVGVTVVFGLSADLLKRHIVKPTKSALVLVVTINLIAIICSALFTLG